RFRLNPREQDSEPSDAPEMTMHRIKGYVSTSQAAMHRENPNKNDMDIMRHPSSLHFCYCLS
ncbi:MAG: hypothetical protein ACPGIC_04025, partial [Opitutales bacterium]